MKCFYFNFLLLIFTVTTNAQQATDFITGLNQPRAILEYNGELYIAENGFNRIIKVNLSDPTPNIIIVKNGIPNIYGLAIKGTELYYSQGPGHNRISKIDLAVENPTSTIIIENIIFPHAIKFYGNDLYIAQFHNDKISKIDVTEPMPAAVDVVTNIETPYALEVVGEQLYIVAWADRKIFRIDLTNPNPVLMNVISNLQLAVGLKLRENFLYIAEAGQSIGNDRVSNIDITQTNPTRTTIVTGLYNPTIGLEIYNDVLYIAENFKISKFELPPLAVDDYTLNSIIAYPNPATDFVKISGLVKQENYKIYNSFGALVKTGVISNNEKINIQYFAAGMYFMVVASENVLKIEKN